MKPNGLKRNGEFIRVFLFAGLLDIALGVAFLIAPLRPAQIQEIKTGGASVELRTARSERESSVIGFVLLACGITLIVAAKPRRRKPDTLSSMPSPTTRQVPGSSTS
jgi:uncharacterized membrane protein HdeD (DUF308 family)